MLPVRRESEPEATPPAPGEPLEAITEGPSFFKREGDGIGMEMEEEE